jgi:hypothetical protein
MNSGATDHITGELEKLTVRNKYQGGDQIHMTSGAGMDQIILLLILYIVPYNSTIFSMFLELEKILFPFIGLPLIILSLLSFTPSSSWSRIRKPGEFCLKGDAWVAYILFL